MPSKPAQEEDSVDIKSPFGNIKVGGANTVLVLIVLLGFAAIAYMIRDHDIRSNERNQEMIVSQNKIHSSMQDMTYVLTIPETERQRLRLSMPDGLRHRMNGSCGTNERCM